MKKKIFEGCGTAIVTPFIDDEINYIELKKLIEFQISSGIDSIVVCGTTGEASTMTVEERKEVIKFTVDIVNGRVPVIAGAGGNCTKDVLAMCSYCDSICVDGLLIVTPYYNKTTQEGLIKHYTVIANSTKLPIILYNVPGRTGLNISPETCLNLSKIENIVAIKEASGNLSQVAKIASLCRDNLYIFSGNDDQILPIMSLGGIGVISVVSNIFPEEVVMMTKKFLVGNNKLAISIQVKLIEVINALFSEVNPIPVKYACKYIGVDAGLPRMPLVPLSDEGMILVDDAINKYKSENI